MRPDVPRVHLIIDFDDLCDITFPIEHSASPPERLPDGRSHTHVVGKVEDYIVDLALEIRVFHDVDRLVVAADEVAQAPEPIAQVSP